MQLPANDRPRVDLLLNAKDGLRVTWGPNVGPWCISSENSTPVQAEIKHWWLGVGTKADPKQLDDSDEPSEYEIIDLDFRTSAAITIPWETLDPYKGKILLARVIGYFNCQNKQGKTIEEGIYSDVARQLIT